MAKIYTAKEMREAADLREAWGDKDEVNNMLRQAADALEREEKREKKYEFCYCDALGSVPSCHFETEDLARLFAYPYKTIVRRPVGEWEEVRDGE